MLRRWGLPVAVLLLTLGVAAAAILEARRAAILNHDSTRMLVRGHSAVAAWTFANAIVGRPVSAYDSVFANTPLLPRSLSDGKPNSEMVIVQVRSANDSIIYSTPGAFWGAEMTEAAGDKKVMASVLFPAAKKLMPDNPTAARIPLLIGLLVLAIVTGAIAAALMRREAHLARVRSDFVSSVSHELRTPLAQIRLFFETLRLGRYNTDEQREWILDNIERESFRLSTLVDNILMFSRTEKGTGIGSREPVEISSYLASLLKEFLPLATVRRAKLELNAEPSVYALLHAESFRQVMLNLLDNAIKYGPAGQTVRINATGHNGKVRIAVEDEGPGIRPREREAIFQPFVRGVDALETAAAGSGIGLSVVREITEWHGGSARVESGSNGGARFVVEVPRA